MVTTSGCWHLHRQMTLAPKLLEWLKELLDELLLVKLALEHLSTITYLLISIH